MDLHCSRPALFQNSGIASASGTSSTSPRRCCPLKITLHQYAPLSCISLTLDRRRNSGEAFHPRILQRYRQPSWMFKCRCATDTPPKLITDGNVTQQSDVNLEQGGDEDGAKGNGDDDEDDDHPLWMEEDDPYWPEDDPEGEGVGFRVSDFFQPKIVNEPNEDGSGSDDEQVLDMEWDAEQYEWIVREISSMEWEDVARQDPTPLIFMAFERYGSRGPDCWKVLVELEKVLRTIADSRKYPIRAVKLDISSEPAVGAALQLKSVPALLFINAGKHLYRVYGYKTEKELLAITSHIFYHSARPECMDELYTSHTVTDVSSSG